MGVGVEIGLCRSGPPSTAAAKEGRPTLSTTLFSTSPFTRLGAWPCTPIFMSRTIAAGLGWWLGGVSCARPLEAASLCAI